VTDPYRPRGLSSAVCYQDAKVYRRLEEAFGLEPPFVILDADGNLGHSEIAWIHHMIPRSRCWRRRPVPVCRWHCSEPTGARNLAALRMGTAMAAFGETCRRRRQCL
jgi:hypothetical protein